MGTDAADLLQTQPYHYVFEVHRSMCMELLKLVDRIERVFPEIEAARPCCLAGIQSLCLLNATIHKAKQHLRYCCESSKLYLVLTGDKIVSRYQKSRKDLEQSLGQIQSMVPTLLAAKICHIVEDLNAAIFTLDHSDEVAGNAVRELIQQGTSAFDSVDDFEVKALQVAASRLHITSFKAILIEMRSIKKLLSKVGDNDPIKKKILKYLLYLLKKYGNLIVEERTENSRAQDEGSVAPVDSVSTVNMDLASKVGFNLENNHYEALDDILSRSTPPEEFMCPISRRLMYDPVVIATGQTFERMWIEKWFRDGNDTCPKTDSKLSHFLLTPNTTMKELISKWCEKNGITNLDPCAQEYQSLDISSMSIASLGMSMNDINLPDFSSMSLGSLDGSYSSDYPRSKVLNVSRSTLPHRNDGCGRFQSQACIPETDSDYLTKLSGLEWNLQIKMIEDVKSYLQCSDQVHHLLTSENFVEPLMRYLKDAHNQRDFQGLQSGLQLLQTFVRRDRSRISHLLDEDAFSLLASLLGSEVTEEALSAMEALSGQPYYRSKITSSVALAPLVNILDSESKDLHSQAIRVLHNLSFISDICLQIVILECIPKLVSFINDGSNARYCVTLLKNLCGTEEGRVSVAETNGCIGSISQLLETGSREEQEHAVAILLSLCSQRVQYCQLVMEEGIIPSLVLISSNGNEKGKAGAIELLRQLRDVDFDDKHADKQEPCGSSGLDTSRNAIEQSKEKKSSSKSSFFGKSLFSKKKR